MATNAQLVQFKSDGGFYVPGIELNDDGTITAVSITAGDLTIAGTGLTSANPTHDVLITAPAGQYVSINRLKLSTLNNNSILFGNNFNIDGTTDLTWNGTELVANGTIKTKTVTSVDGEELIISSSTTIILDKNTSINGEISADTASFGDTVTGKITSSASGSRIRFNFDSFATFPPASAWEGSLAYAHDTRKIYISIGTEWREVVLYTPPEESPSVLQVDIQSTGLSTFENIQISGGTIDGTTIGLTTPASAAFTSASVANAPLLGNEITNKSYVDRRVGLAIALAG